MGDQYVKRMGIDPALGQSLQRGILQEVPGKKRDILTPFAKSRQGDRHDVQAVEQVFAKLARCDLLAEIAVRRRDDADIGADRPRAADRRELAGLQDASRRVCASIGISPISSRNSVPPAACSNRPALRCAAPVKAPRSCPNNSASINSRGIAAMLSATKGAARRGPRSWIAGRPTPCRFRFARDEHRQIGRHDARDYAVHALHRLRSADQRQGAVILPQPVLDQHTAPASAPATAWVSASRSKGLGRYSYAPTSAARGRRWSACSAPTGR